MATYALDKYGLTKYGFEALVEYDAEPFIATALQHDQLELSWFPPQGAYDRLRLVRNAYGNPVTEDDGIVLFDTPRREQPRTYLDRNLPGGSFAYYTLFVREPIGLGFVWRRVADTFGLVTNDYRGAETLLERLPTVFTTNIREVGGYADRDTPLARFLSIFGYELDTIRTIIATLRDTRDPDRVPASLLPLLAQQIGQVYEPAIGQIRNRVLTRNSVYLFKMKGTSTAATGVASALTGWAATLVEGRNLLLESDDASAETSVGQWQVTAGLVELSVREADEPGTDGFGPTAVLGYRTPADDVRYHGMFSVRALEAGRAELRLPAGGTRLVDNLDAEGNVLTPPTRLVPSGTLEGIPVQGGYTDDAGTAVPGLPYTLSVRFRDRGTHRIPRLALAWFDRLGYPLSTTDEQAGPTTRTDDWDARTVLTATAPVGARYAQPIIVWPELAVDEEQLFDAVQFEQGPAATDFRPARQVVLQLEPDRRNRVTNPGFEVNTAGWEPVDGNAVARFTDNVHGGTGAMRVTAGRARTTVRLTPTQTYTASLWVFGPAGTYGLSLSSSSTSVAVAADTWTQLSLVHTAGGQEASAQLTVSGPTGATYRVDEAVVEEGAGVRSYFDGDYASGQTGWTGERHASESVFYHHRVIRDDRLRAHLPRYLPVGTSYELSYADGFRVSVEDLGAD